MNIPRIHTRFAVIATVFLVFVAALLSASDRGYTKGNSGGIPSQGTSPASINKRDRGYKSLTGSLANPNVFSVAARRENARLSQAFDFLSDKQPMVPIVRKMKSATEAVAVEPYAKLLNPKAGLGTNSTAFMSTATNFPTNSYIINMGITPQTVANGLKPYGLIFALVRTNGIPVYWAIKDNKVAFDEIDFSFNPGTPNAVRDYRSGAFIISGDFVNASVITTINTWKAMGVIVDGPTTAPMTNIPIYDTITYFPNTGLNSENSSIGAGFYVNAGIPSSAYAVKAPSSLGTCDDLFVMPHSDPTWATHNNLLTFNNNGGFIWAGCHSVSVLEDLDDTGDADLITDMNFLSTAGLAHFDGDYPTNNATANHADGAGPPYVYDTAFVSDPIMQILYNNGNASANEKGMDGAQENGSEQIYLPLVFNVGGAIGQITSAWNTNARVAIYDTAQANIPPQNSPKLSDGEAAKLVYGRGFDNPNNGMVMYQGSHNISTGGTTVPARVQAQRAYFNFVLLSGINQRPSIAIGGVPATFIPGQSYPLTTTVTGGNPAFTYAWTSTCGGTFSPSASNANPTYTAPGSGTTCRIQVTVTDACLRANFNFTNNVPLQPSADLAITKTDGVTTVNAGGTTTYTITVTNTGPSAANGAIFTDPAATGLTATSVTCGSAAGGAVCPTAGNTTVALMQGGGIVIPTLPSGGSLVFTVMANVTATSGSVTNTANIAAPAGVTDTNTANNTASDTDTVTPVSDLAITKTDGVTTVNAGGTTTYTIVVSNLGPSSANGAIFRDPAAAGISPTSVTCGSAAGGAVCPTAGNTTVALMQGAGIVIPTLPSGGSVTFTVMVNVTATSGSITNTATISEPAGNIDPNAANDSASDTDTVTPQADLSVTKTNGTASVNAGGTTSYTIVVTNNGPSAANNAVFTDPAVTGLTATSVMCSGATGGAACPTAGNTTVALMQGAGIVIPTLPSGGSVTFTVAANVTAMSGTVTNTANIAPPAGTTDPTPGNNTASDSDPVNPVTDLAITKTDGSATYTPGNAITYTIVVSNNGPSNATGASVADTIPAAITGTTINCVASGTATCGTNASAGNSLSFTGVNINSGAGNFLTITVSGTVNPSTTGNLVNTATVTAGAGQTDSTPGNNSATDTDTQSALTDLSISKTDGSATYTAGNAITYTIVVNNAGPSNATGVSVADTIPASITGTTISCVASGTANCGTNASSGNNLSFTGVSINSGGANFLTITVSGTINPATTGNLVNTATVAAGAGQTDPTPGNNTATDTDTPAPQTDLAITKTDGSATYTAGNAITYTIVVTNNGPSNATGVSVTDTIPASITGTAISCVANGSASCGTNGSAGNNLSYTNVSIAAGVANSLTITVSGTVGAGTTGNLVNTVTVTAGAGQTDPTPGNNTATDTDTPNAQTDLAVTKTDGSATYTAGNAITYTIVVSNSGPSNATGASVADTIPASITGTTINCVASGTATCGTNASAGNNLSFTGVNINAGAANFLTITVSGTVGAGTTGNLVNTVTVTAGAGQTDPTPGNNTATDTDTPNPQTDLAITKTDGSATYTPGNVITYTIVVSNNGPSNATGASVADAIPAAITGTTIGCVATGTATCGTNASAGNNLSFTGVNINAGAGNFLTITVSGTINPATTGNLVNTATVTAGAGQTDPTPGNNSATDTDTSNPIADLAVQKNGPVTVTAGGIVTYTIRVSNAGPSSANGATVTDPFPGVLTGVTWTCGAGTGGATCGTANGVGNINTTVTTFPPGGSVTFTVTGTAPASGTFVNTATVTAPAGVTDPDLSNNNSSVTTGVGPAPTNADLAVIKSGPASVAANGAITYTIVVTNAGPGAANGATVMDTVPAGITGVTWTCGNATAGAVCGAANGSGNINTTITTFPVGASVTFTVTGTAPASGTFTNTVTVATPAGVTDPNPANNTSSVTTTVAPTPTTADLYAVKTGPSTVGPNAAITYKVIVGNSGPSGVTNAPFSDIVPAAVTGVNWTCGSATGGASCGTPSGSGNTISFNIASLPAGSTVTLTITGTGPASGTFVNSALITPPTGVTDSDPTDNIGGPVITNVVIVADLAITKTDGSATYTPGSPVTYTIVVTNNGPDAITNASVTDTFPAAVTSASWTCVASGGSSCGAANGTGNISTTVSLLLNGTATYTVTAQISPAATGNLVNTATVAVPAGVTDPTPGNNSATDTDTPNPQTDLSITKTDGSTTYTPGGGITYTIVVANAGPSNATGVVVADTVPASITGLTVNCVATGTANCGTNGSAGNNVSFTGASVSAGAGNFLTITVSGTINPATTGSLINTATVTPGAGQTDPNNGNNSATDTDSNDAMADLSITKTDGAASYIPGTSTTYTVVVTNNGPSAVNNASVVDTLPAGITSATWTCLASAGGNCDAANGTGSINTTVDLNPGATATFTINAQISSAATGNLVNTATVATPPGVTDPTPGNNSATDTDTPNLQTDLAVTKTDGSATYTAGNAISYTITVSNNGPSNATGASVADAIPAAITGTTINCVASGTASCGTNASAGNALSFTNVSVAAGAGNFLTITVMGTVNPATTGNLTNTVTVTAGAGQTDPTPGNNSATDTDTPNAITDLSITKTDGSATYTAGNAITYTIVVGNTGPSNATGASVADTIPAAITGTTINCVASGTASCGTNGSAGNALSFTNVSIAAGAANFLTITVSGTVNPATTGNLVNTATVTAGAGQSDPTPGNNSATDTDTPNTLTDLSITKTDGSTTYTPGSGITYTIVVNNAGPSNATGVSVADTIPASISGLTINCTPSGAANCGTNNSAGNNVSFLNASISAGAANFLTITVSGTIAPGTTGNLTNTATVTPGAGQTDSNLANNTATDIDSNNPQADLTITKTDGTGTYTPGTSTTYTIVVTNNGPSSVSTASVIDNLPAGVTSAAWTCLASVGGSCAAPNGTGNINTTVNLAPGATATFTVVAQISSTATGNLVNTASVQPPAGVTDPVPGNNSATDTDTPTPVSDLAITKTDGSATYTPGASTTYTITVSNAGPSAVTNAPVTDTFPAAVTSATWTCVASGGSTCGAPNGSGNISTTVNLLVGGTATFTVTAQISAAATGNLVNTATVAAPAGTTDPTPGNNSATDTDTPAPVADLAVTKTDGSATYTAGTNTVYTMVVSNSGPSNITGATVTDNLPAGQVNVAASSWTCVATAGSSCGAPSGSGNIATTVNLIVGGSATFTYTVPVLAGASGNLTNTVTVNPPAGATDPNQSNNSATDTDTPFPQTDLGVTKVSAPATYTPGGTVVWTIVATNNGPSTINGGTVTDLFPAAVTSASWTCTASAGSSCTLSNGNGNISTTVNLLPSGTATFIVTAQISPTATGNLTNTVTVNTPAGVTDSNPSNNSATETDTPAPVADLRMSKTDGSATYTPGGSTTYTIVVTNDGPSAVTGATVTDSLPAGATSGSWTCAASAGSSCTAAAGNGSINTTVSLLPAGTATFTLTVQIASGATGNLVNTATVTTPAGTTDPNPGNNSATDTDTPAPQADLAITKTDGQTTSVPGQTVTYTIVATNNGPSDVTGATVADTLPANLSGATWTCAASAGSSCGAANGTGNINTTVNLLRNGTATFTLTATISASATGSLTNTATVTTPAGTTDPTPGNNTATDTNTLTPQADLAITKTDGSATYTAGGTVVYTIVATNNGPSVATNALITDTLPAAITSATWTCTASAGSSCGSANGTGNINATATLLVNGTATFTVTAQVSPNATGNLVNTANVAPPQGTTDPNQGNNSATDTDTPNPQADLAITKTDGATTYTAGLGTTYTIVVTNNGPSSVNNAAVVDNLPAGITSATWTCVASVNGNCDAANGNGSINTTVDLAPGATATFTVVAQISATATGNLVNTATVTNPAGTTDPNPGNNSATDTNTPAPQADLAITKTDGVTAATPGGQTVYTIVAVNNGPSAVVGATITDTFPAAITSATWTCAAAGGAVCPNANGAGNINQVANLPVGGSLTYTVLVDISPNATGNLVNTATIAVPAGTTDPTPGNNSATDIDVLGPNADIVVQKNGTGIVQVNGAVSYVIEIKNLGPSSANGTTFSDTLPAGLTGATAICTSALAGAVCPGVLTVNAGVVTGTIPTLPPGGNLVITITGNAPATIGTMTNVATATPPTGVNDPNPGNNTSAAMTEVINVPVPPVANLAVTKVGTSTVQTNGTISYVVTVTNAGPGAANGASFSDTVPAVITNVSWVCQAAGGAVCPNPNGVGNVISQTIATFPASGLLTYTITGTAPASAQSITNTATVTPPNGVTDPDPGDNSSSQPTTVQTPPPTSADLVIAKTGPANVAPNGQMTYTVVVTNKGPAAADGAIVSDNLPNVLTNVSAVCSASGGAICGATSVGADNLLTGVITKMPVWGIITYTITATAPQSGSFTNSATVTPPPGVTDPDPGSNTGGPVVTTVGPTVADLSITKTNNTSTVVAGAFTTYTVVVTNNGPAAVTNAAVNDNLPASLVNATWTCQASAGSSCTSAAGNGSINTNVSLLSGGVALFTITAQVLPTATGTITNTGTVTPPPGVTDPNLGNNTATDGLDVIQPVADLVIQKTDNTSVYTPGGQTTYTVVVTNLGPSAVTNAAVADALPTGITSATWTCSATAGSSCGAALGNGSIASTVSLLPGGQAVFTIHAVISPNATGNLVNTATVTAPQGVTDPNPGNNTSTDTNTPQPLADLAIIKTNNAATVTPGGQTTYTIRVNNNGPSAVVNAPVADTLPAGLTNASWTCTASAGSSCGAANGTGNIATTVSLSPGGMATFTLTATVAVGQTAPIVNTATVTPPPGVIDPDLTDNSSTDVDPVQPVADLAITKTNNATTVVPGMTTTYQIVVTNNGPSAVTNAQVGDALPAGITSATWTCAASAGSSCGAANGVGSINTTVNLLPGGTATYTLIAQVSPNATGILTNTALVTAPQGTIDPNTSNNTATDSDPLTPQGNLSITKTNGVTTVNTGGTTTYTIVATNSGPSGVTGATVTDNISPFLTNATWTCVASAGSSCGAPNGSGSIGTTVNLIPGGTATFTLTGTIAASATGNLVNTVTITPPNNFTDTNPADNSATDTDTVTEIADLSILKTNFVSQLAPGGQTQYTILVTNLGPSNANNAAVVDTPPASLTNVSWTCVASAGSTCAVTNGTGAINTTVSLLSGGTATFLLNATVSQTATGTIANTATVTPATVNCRNLGCVTDPNQGNNTSTDTDPVQTTADLAITKTANVQTVPPGGPLTYTITVRNNGPSNVTGAQVTDTFSSKLTNISWTCAATAGSSCAVPNGTGNISTQVNLLANGTATFVVTANALTTATGTIENVASVTAPAGTTDPNLGNNTTPVVVVVIVSGVDLAITKSHTGNFQVGHSGTYRLSVENVSQFPTTGTITVTDTLPNGLIYQSATGQGWTCSAAGQIVTCTRNAPLQSGAISEITLQVFVTSVAYPSVINTATVSTPGDMNASNNTATDPTVVENGQGVQGDPFPPTSPISDQKPGSILIYPVYTSDAVNGNSQNTRLTLTNTDPARAVAVHLFFVDGTSCSVADSYICLTAQQTTSFLASDIDPGTTGYVIAVAVNDQGCPIIFNQLIGDEYVKFATGHQANLGAEAVAALPGLLNVPCTLNTGTVALNFDGVMYNALPRVLADDSIGSKADGNDTMLIVDRIGGNLSTGASTLGTLFGILYDDAEVGVSFSLSGGCQLRGSLSNNFPRTTPRFEQFIPAGRSGWLKIYSQNSGAVGIVGAAIRFNPNSSASAGAFNQGHNLHKLTLTTEASVIFPIFPPSCQ